MISIGMSQLLQPMCILERSSIILVQECSFRGQNYGIPYTSDGLDWYYSRLSHESSWWFPRLASRDDDGAVFGSRESNNEGIDAIEEDSSESDEEQLNERELENDALADTFRD